MCLGGGGILRFTAPGISQETHQLAYSKTIKSPSLVILLLIQNDKNVDKIGRMNASETSISFSDILSYAKEQ